MRCFRFLAVLTFLFLSGCFLAQGAFALDVTSIRFGQHSSRERAVIELSGPTEFRAFVMQSPDRLVVDMGEFRYLAGTINRPNGISVMDVRFGQLGGGKGRLVLQTSVPVVIQSAFFIPAQNGQSSRIVLDYSALASSNSPPQILGTMSSSASPQMDAPSLSYQTGSVILPQRKPWSSATAASASRSPEPTSSQTFSAPSREKPLIILDAGHGGEDPGARGANGTYEKTIVLAVALELRRQLEATGRYRVKMTRDSDVFIPLRGRVNFARKAKGDLFISLHADSIRDSQVTGASIYTLSDVASDKEAQKLADRENKSDLIAGVDLSHQEEDVTSILLDLAARDTMNQSRFLAKNVVGSFRRNDIRTLENAQRSAGFAVLKALDIPSILIEMGYLTNRNEVERLSSPDHRRRIASAILGAVDSYFQKTSSR